MNLLDLYYLIKPLIPRRLQLALRRRMVLQKLPKVKHTWPIDPSAGQKPEGRPGWPDGKPFALVLTHDVETYMLLTIFNLCVIKWIISNLKRGKLWDIKLSKLL